MLKPLLQLCFLVCLTAAVSLGQQPVRTAPAGTSAPDDVTDRSVKKNGRPARSADAASEKAFIPVYTYEFTRPGFTYDRILIQHDENGRGTIAFKRDAFPELITDPISLTPVTMSKLTQILKRLNFLDSTTNYQYSKDYSHLGNNRITVKQGGRERTVSFNWTDDQDARDLTDLYRSVANEYTWRFELTSALENQTLLTPGLMDELDAYLQRNEIADPPHLVPFLRDLSSDERMPLIARNHAARLAEKISKAKK